MTHPAHRLIHESEMVENDPGRSGVPAVLNSLWRGLAGGRDAKIMVSNMSGNAVVADVFLDFASQRHSSAPLSFNPHETIVLSVASLLSAVNTTPAQAPGPQRVTAQPTPQACLR